MQCTHPQLANNWSVYTHHAETHVAHLRLRPCTTQATTSALCSRTTTVRCFHCGSPAGSTEWYSGARSSSLMGVLRISRRRLPRSFYGRRSDPTCRCWFVFGNPWLKMCHGGGTRKCRCSGLTPWGVYTHATRPYRILIRMASTHVTRSHPLPSCCRIPQSIHNIGYARVQYPPPTFGASLELSRSKAVSALYAEAEQLPATLPLLNWVVPPQYLTWPNGQLSAAARNGGYAANIRRWHRWFTPARFEYFELSEYAVEGGTAAVLRKLHRRLPPSYRDRVSIASIARTVEDRHANANSGGGPTTSIPFPTDAELEDAAAFYAPLNEDLFALLGHRYPSWSNPHPANRSQPQSPR